MNHGNMGFWIIPLNESNRKIKTSTTNADTKAPGIVESGAYAKRYVCVVSSRNKSFDIYVLI